MVFHTTYYINHNYKSGQFFNTCNTTQNVLTCYVNGKKQDITPMNVPASRFGFKSADLKYIFNHVREKPSDSLLIDTTRKQK